MGSAPSRTTRDSPPDLTLLRRTSAGRRGRCRRRAAASPAGGRAGHRRVRPGRTVRPGRDLPARVPNRAGRSCLSSEFSLLDAAAVAPEFSDRVLTAAHRYVVDAAAAEPGALLGVGDEFVALPRGGYESDFSA